jgi:two-component system, NarL family, nitrate/nitrite response regulator NarL
MPRDQKMSDASRTSVLVVDSGQASYYDLMSGLARTGRFKTVRGAHTVRAARRLAQTLDFDVAIISTVHDRTEQAYHLVRALSRQPRSVRSLVVARDWAPAQIVEAFRSGAKGLLSSKTELPKIVKAISCVMEGQIWANSEQLNHTLDYLVNGPPTVSKSTRSVAALTARESEVANLLSKGASNKDIAKALHISERTVKNHLRSIFSKIGVNSRVQAVLSLVG